MFFQWWLEIIIEEDKRKNRMNNKEYRERPY